MLQWFDNFQNYGSGTAGVENALDGLVYLELNGGSAQFPIDPDGISGTRVFGISGDNENSNTGDNRMALPSPTKVLGTGARFWRNSLPGSNGVRPSLFAWRNGSNQKLADLVVEPNGALTMYYDGLNVAATTTVPYFTTRTWQHIEAKINMTTGDFEVRREGLPILTGTLPVAPDENISILGWTNRQDFTSSTSITLWMKDLIVWDTVGTYNNDFMGTCTVVTMRPNSDSSSTGLVPSTGTDLYAAIDDAVPDDADYLTAADVATGEFGLTDLPADITSVKGIMTMIRAMKTDGGDAKMQVSLKSGALYDTGADRPITPTWTFWFDISEEDPNTSAAWTPGTANDALLKIERTL